MRLSRDAAHGHTDAVNFQLAACDAFSPGMRRPIDVDAIWSDGRDSPSLPWFASLRSQ